MNERISENRDQMNLEGDENVPSYIFKFFTPINTVPEFSTYLYITTIIFGFGVIYMKRNGLTLVDLKF